MLQKTLVQCCLLAAWVVVLATGRRLTPLPLAGTVRQPLLSSQRVASRLRVEAMAAPRSVRDFPVEMLTRREGMQNVVAASAGFAAGMAVDAGNRRASAESNAEYNSRWVAKDGVSFLTSFDEANYGAMRDDTRRTPLFIKAIIERNKARPGMTVLDIGTGPFALFALVAARAGAKKVYAIEANPEAAARARLIVDAADDIPKGKIEVIEGFTSAVKLPEKVDLVVAEIMGAIASEENCINTIKDVQKRFLKNPTDPESYIPVSIQTYGAPVSYALHPVLAPPRFERLQGQPLRVNCRDTSVELLSDPQLFENIEFPDTQNLPQPGKWQAAKQPPKFVVSESRVANNTETYFKALVKEEVKEDEARKVAQETASTFSGMAFWPRLVLNTAGDIIVESRGPLGEHQKSHWPTVLSLMNPTPVPVSVGSQIEVDEIADLPQDILQPITYSVRAKIRSA